MRLSRDRNWGHPRLLDCLERFAADARTLDGWPGLLVGDMSQPRGGPMITGHSSHQVGLDVDLWLTPMPDRTLTAEERENMIAVSMLKDPLTVDRDKVRADGACRHRLMGYRLGHWWFGDNWRGYGHGRCLNRRHWRVGTSAPQRSTEII
jgi:hypothetical protein